MASLRMQRRIASELLGVGENRVWIDPSKLKELKDAITREDIKKLIDQGAIRRKALKGQSRARARLLHEKKSRGHRKGRGSRKGKMSSRVGTDWRLRVRALRSELKKQLLAGSISKTDYRHLYRRVKGGAFHSVSHLRNVISTEYKKV